MYNDSGLTFAFFLLSFFILGLYFTHTGKYSESTLIIYGMIALGPVALWGNTLGTHATHYPYWLLDTSAFIPLPITVLFLLQPPKKIPHTWRWNKEPKTLMVRFLSLYVILVAAVFGVYYLMKRAFEILIFIPPLYLWVNSISLWLVRFLTTPIAGAWEAPLSLPAMCDALFWACVVKISFALLLQGIAVMAAVAFFTLLERKVLGYVQSRKGPNKPGPSGLFVPFADALKLLRKEPSWVFKRNKLVFFSIPCYVLFVPLFLWSIYPTTFERTTLKYSGLFFLCVSTIGVYGIIGAGWGRNRKYSILGAIRAVAQSVSYEVGLRIIIIHWTFFYYFTLSQRKLTPLGVFLFLVLLLLFVRSLAETNRSPFDFSEGESELVRGFNTEYSATPFVMLFLAEYMSILLMSAVVSLLFNMSNTADGYVFLTAWSFVFVWRRGTVPRLRYDQLMYIAWKCYLPIVLGSAGFVLVILYLSKNAFCFQ